MKLCFRLTAVPLLAVCVTVIGFAQRDLPIERPKQRDTSETPKIKPPARQTPNTPNVYVFLNPIVPGQVVVKSATGKLIKQGEANQNGEASFILPRGQSYQIEATSPGYNTVSAVAKPGATPAVVRIDLNATSRILRFLNLPAGSEVLIDNKPAEVKVTAGESTVEGVTAAKHKLVVRHAEFNEFKMDLDLSRMSIGERVTVSVNLERVAKLTIQSVAGAEVMIDGALQGRIPGSGSITIEYPINQPREHVITVEKPGYISKTLRERLTAGVRTLAVDLEPFANPEGASDGFDNLNQWNHPPTWRPTAAANNRTLTVAGARPGFLKDKVYRDFQSVFTVCIPDGMGLTWLMRADAAGQNYYMFHLSGPKSTTHIPNRFYSYVVKAGAAPVEVNTPTPLVVDLNATTSFLIHVVARGYTIEHSITSNESGEKVTLGLYTDSSATKDKFLYGLFGFRSLAGETFIVDDFTIDPKPETVNTRPR